MKNLKAILAFLILHAVCCISATAQWTALKLNDTLIINNDTSIINTEILDLPLNSIDFVNDSTGFIAACNGGPSVWSEGAFLKTTDAGNTWNYSFGSYCISSVFFVNDNIGYISGVWLNKTTDGGITWFAPGPTSGLNSSFVYFINDSVGFINGTGNTIRKTINGGISWYHSSNFNPPSYIYSVYFTSEQVGFAVGSSLLLKTTDGGDNWNVIDTNYSLLSVQFPSSNIGYAVGFNGTIVKTTDTGNNWFPQTSGVSNSVSLNSIFCLNDTICYAVGDSGTILKTTDGGNNWVKQNTGVTFGLYSISCTNTHCYAAGDSGVILKTIDGEVGINETKKNESEIKVYPNPAKANIRIEIAKEVVVKTIKLYDLNGKLIKTFSHTDTLLIIAGIEQGKYLLLITTNKGIFTEKIIKQ